MIRRARNNFGLNYSLLVTFSPSQNNICTLPEDEKELWKHERKLALFIRFPAICVIFDAKWNISAVEWISRWSSNLGCLLSQRFEEQKLSIVFGQTGKWWRNGTTLARAGFASLEPQAYKACFPMPLGFLKEGSGARHGNFKWRPVTNRILRDNSTIIE
jgi:hypothetical protein